MTGQEYPKGFQFLEGRYILKRISNKQVAIKVGKGAYTLCDDRWNEGYGYICTGRILTLNEVKNISRMN